MATLPFRDAILLPFDALTVRVCSKAKAALRSVGATFEVMELDQRPDGNAIQDALAAVRVVSPFLGASSFMVAAYRGSFRTSSVREGQLHWWWR